MFCDGCAGAGAGAGDCSCALAIGAAVARMAAVRNCAHSRIIFSPILHASSPRTHSRQHPKALTLNTSHISEECSGGTERSDMSRRHDGTNEECRQMELGSDLFLRAVQGVRGVPR